MSAEECVEALIERYPDQAAWIEQMHDLDQTFQEICNDRYNVVVSLSTLERRSRGIQHEVDDLVILLGQLDAEIAKYLGR
ncbi:MAG: hypothetical protein ACR2NG_09730 [Acidimicrobiia bacterium]